MAFLNIPFTCADMCGNCFVVTRFKTLLVLPRSQKTAHPMASDRASFETTEQGCSFLVICGNEMIILQRPNLSNETTLRAGSDVLHAILWGKPPPGKMMNVTEHACVQLLRDLLERRRTFALTIGKRFECKDPTSSINRLLPTTITTASQRSTTHWTVTCQKIFTSGWL